MKRVKKQNLYVCIMNEKTINIQENKIYNGWSLSNTTTLIDWIIYSNLYVLLLETYANHVRNVLKVNTLWSLLISSVTSTISITQLTVSDVENPLLSFVIKSAIVLTSVLTSMITGYIKIEKMQEKMEFLDKTRDRWMRFMLELTSELQQGISLRQNAVELIKSKRIEFNKLCTKRIDIPPHIKTKVSKYLTKHKHHNLDINCINILSKCCINCYNRKNKKKQLIDETQRRLGIYYIIINIVSKQLLRMGEIFKTDIKTIIFDESSHLINYEIVKHDVYMVNENADINETIKRYSPMIRSRATSINSIINNVIPPLPPSSNESSSNESSSNESSSNESSSNESISRNQSTNNIKILSKPRHDNVTLKIDA